MNINFIPKTYAQGFTQSGSIEGPGSFQKSYMAFGGLEIIVSRLIGAITAVAGLAFLVYFILGGINWITAAGDQAKVDKAKKQLTDAAIGLVVVVVTYFVVGIVGTVLGIDILNPAAILQGITQ